LLHVKIVLNELCFKLLLLLLLLFWKEKTKGKMPKKKKREGKMKKVFSYKVYWFHLFIYFKIKTFINNPSQKHSYKHKNKYITESRSFKPFWRPFFLKPILRSPKTVKGKDLSLSGWCRLYRTYVHLARNNSRTQFSFKQGNGTLNFQTQFELAFCKEDSGL
jgi:hypothetical protein